MKFGLYINGKMKANASISRLLSRFLINTETMQVVVFLVTTQKTSNLRTAAIGIKMGL